MKILLAILIILVFAQTALGMGRTGNNPDVDVETTVEEPEISLVREPHIEQGEGTWAGIRFGGTIPLGVALIIQTICFTIIMLRRRSL